MDWKTAVLLLPSTSLAVSYAVLGLEDCRIITSFYSLQISHSVRKIGRLPYYYFLLLLQKSGVETLIGRLPYYYFLLLRPVSIHASDDWKTAVLLLPSTFRAACEVIVGLEDCRIITSFY